MTQDISQKILERIKEKHIEPKPKWEFILKDWFVWLSAVLSLIIGSLAFSVIIYMTRYNDWDVYERIESNLVKFIFATLPYFWLIFLAIFIISAYFNFKHTKKGYKFGLTKIIIAVISVSLLLGALLYNFGLGYAIDKLSAERLPFYEHLMGNRHAIWEKPSEGFMVCEITEVIDDNNVIADDPNGNSWNIFIQNTPPDFSKIAKVGEKIRVIGEEKSDNLFYAEIVMPARPPMENWFDNKAPKKSEGARNKNEEINQNCGIDDDCLLPFEYAVRSDCPFENKCINGTCQIVCPIIQTEVMACEKNSDCDCPVDQEATCICLDKKCFINIE